ncbi:hypothetical protein [Clostridium manihotivorum]|nr:hypothetical protein [Clostridium manihotivorum]
MDHGAKENITKEDQNIWFKKSRFIKWHTWYIVKVKGFMEVQSYA